MSQERNLDKIYILRNCHHLETLIPKSTELGKEKVCNFQRCLWASKMGHGALALATNTDNLC